ncbi:MAG: carbamoyltransferase HypF [Bacteroidota bacterium]|nr:carbamoyltransferase HypF [Bacteroidota bacterium]
MLIRLHIAIRGAVQGVGFRPFVYRIATEMKLNGFVLNSSKGVFIEAEGEKSVLDKFLMRLENEKPNISVITSLEFSFLDPVGFQTFEIRESTQDAEISAFILPDIAVCEDCLNEMFDQENRRYLYPFINCTNCGPRFSIVETLPYDRPNTSMKNFTMCIECRREYENPIDRRFHAQPTACPICGPQIELWNKNGEVVSEKFEAITKTVELIEEGKIIAFKGLGGYQLIVDASNNEAVSQLRKRKQREEKPLALMSPNIDFIKMLCDVSQFEERLLLSPESPIVLLKRKLNSEKIISELIAPGNPYLGAMLPYTPLHHLLMKLLVKPVVATSGNLSEELMCINEHQALKRLSGIADYFLVHNRPIVRHVDDSIVRIINGREMVLRRARGYAPLPILIETSNLSKPTSIIAVGAHLKNTIALTNSNSIFISQHIGDLATNEAYQAFSDVISDFEKMYNSNVLHIAHDLHPEYLSTKYAQSGKRELIGVQHHQAHIASCYAENRLSGNTLGVAWDGTGYGTDGTIWGGEFFIYDGKEFNRVATFKQFRLPGGEQAIKEPRRAALGILYEIYGDKIFKPSFIPFMNNYSTSELQILRLMFAKNINCPITSSAGRLFDAVSALIGIKNSSAFEGQAAMMLEFAADSTIEENSYSFNIHQKELYEVDWRTMIEEILEDVRNNIIQEIIAKKFHNTMAHIILKIAQMIPEYKVVLSGGCFQNAILLEETIMLLKKTGFKPYWHQRIPPNDGGISLGQAVIALNKINYKIKE